MKSFGTFGRSSGQQQRPVQRKRKRTSSSSSAAEQAWSVRVAKRSTKCSGKTCCALAISAGFLRFDRVTSSRHMRFPKTNHYCFRCFFKSNFTRNRDDLDGLGALPGDKYAYVKKGFAKHYEMDIGPQNGVSGPQSGVSEQQQRPRAPQPTTMPTVEAARLMLKDLYKVDELRPFQLQGVAFCAAQKRALIADEMGLGKTVQAVKLMEFFGSTSLVVAPSAVRLNWLDEISKWSGLRGITLSKRSDSVPADETFDVVVVSYGVFVKNSHLAESINEFRFNTIILDESHMIKNRDSARTKQLAPIVSKVEHAFLLSGTPALSRPLELFPQVFSLRPDLFKGGFNSYVKKFCDPKTRFIPGRGHVKDYTGASNLPELHSLLSEFCVRRTKAEVLSQLPAKIRSRVRLDKVKKVGKYDFKADIDELRNNHSGSASESMVEWYQKTGLAKIKAVEEYIRERVISDSFPENQPSFLIFAHHVDVLDAVERCVLEKTRDPDCVIRIDGSTSMKNRSEFVKKFQAGSCKFAVLSLTAAGVGITLTKATQVVFAELHWTPGILRQAEDRAHRIGQRHSVNISYLLAPGTADDALWRSVEKKIDTVSQAIDGVRAKNGLDARGEEERAQAEAMEQFLRRVDPPEIVDVESSESDDAVVEQKAPTYPKSDLRSFFVSEGRVKRE